MLSDKISQSHRTRQLAIAQAIMTAGCHPVDFKHLQWAFLKDDIWQLGHFDYPDLDAETSRKVRVERTIYKMLAEGIELNLIKNIGSTVNEHRLPPGKKWCRDSWIFGSLPNPYRPAMVGERITEAMQYSLDGGETWCNFDRSQHQRLLTLPGKTDLIRTTAHVSQGGKYINGFTLPDGDEWTSTDWTYEMLPEGYRPVAESDETIDSNMEYSNDGKEWFTFASRLYGSKLKSFPPHSRQDHGTVQISRSGDPILPGGWRAGN